MEQHPLALPLAALMAWTMVMFIWMYATRIPAMIRAGYDIKTMRGTTGKSLDDRLPAEVQWKAHNYNHLLEQPVLFYAVCLLLMLLGHEGEGSLLLAWSYVVLRVAHSLTQATINVIRVRFPLFFLASLALLGLIVIAVLAASASA